MKKQPEIIAILDLFRTRESGNLQIDEPAALKAYEKANADRSGIAIKVLTVVGGFLVTCAFLGFLFLAGFYESGIGMGITGFFFVAGALIVKKLYDKLILDTFSVSFFVCGCLLLLLSANELRMNETVICVLFIIIALVSLAIVQNYMMSFTATCILHAAIIGLLQTYRYNNPILVHVYTCLLLLFFTCWLLKEAAIITASPLLPRLYNPVRLGTLVAVLFAGINVSGNGWLGWSNHFNYIPAITAIACTLLLIPQILKALELQQPAATVLAFAAAILVLAPTIRAPAIAIALLVILASFYVNYKTGIVAGILALLWFVSEFYYFLHYTLLTKSIMMMATGVFFLLFYFLTHKKLLSK
jgi:uncharacterized membrane protein